MMFMFVFALFLISTPLCHCFTITMEVPAGVPIAANGCSFCSSIPVPGNETLFIVNATFLDMAKNVQTTEFLACTRDKKPFKLPDNEPMWLTTAYGDFVCPYSFKEAAPLLSHMNVPKVGIKVGKGTAIDHIMLCNHYHDAQSKTLSGLTQLTRLKIEMEPASQHQDMESAGVVLIGGQDGYKSPFGTNYEISSGNPTVVRHIFDRPTNLSVFAATAHSHRMGYSQLREEVFLTRAGCSKEAVLIANISADGLVQPEPMLLPQSIAIHEHDVLTLKCYWTKINDISEPVTGHSGEHADAICHSDMLYFADDGAILPSNYGFTYSPPECSGTM